MFAVIDLGSNSFHLLIADHTDGHFSVIDRHSEKVQLAEKIFQTGILQESAMQRGIDCLTRFKKVVGKYPIQKLSVVATQAMRQAGNADDFQQRAKSVGLDIEIISGPREAALIYRGICDPLPDANFNRLIIDIGGASTEIALGADQNVLVAESNAIGCVSWRDRFFSDSFNYIEQAPAAKAAATEVFSQVRKKLNDYSWQECYASSGTAKMLNRIVIANDFGKGKVTRSYLEKIEQLLSAYTRSEDITIAGLTPERQDLLAPGLCIMLAVMDGLGVESFEFSPTALREGVLREITSHRVDYRLDD